MASTALPESATDTHPNAARRIDADSAADNDSNTINGPDARAATDTPALKDTTGADTVSRRVPMAESDDLAAIFSMPTPTDRERARMREQAGKRPRQSISPAPIPWPNHPEASDSESDEEFMAQFRSHWSTLPPEARAPSARIACPDPWTRSIPVVAIALLLSAGLGDDAATAGPPPCPPLVEVPCSGHGENGGGPPIAEPCVPGPGGWIRTLPEEVRIPQHPIDLRDQYTFGLTRWNSSTQARADSTAASCAVSLSGQSIFLGAGSQSLASSATFQRTTREIWDGLGPAAPRIVQLVANGFAGLSIAVTCGPSRGCSATASAGAAGGCHSLGDASAILEPKSIGGTAIYDSAESVFRLEGDLGTSVDDSGPSMTGDISSEISWTLQGIGAASGTASYVVRPDRTYCAYTNRPIVRRSFAATSAAVAVSVNAGSAAAVGIATAGFDVN